MRYYFKVQAFLVLMLLLWQAIAARLALAAPNNATWEAGRLDYTNGSAEVAAFVNQEQVQLQVVLCSLNLPSAYRLTLLLSKIPQTSGLIPIKLLVDGATTHAYAEVSGNSVELQVSIPFLISLTYSPSLDIVFSPYDARALQLPETLHISMEQADLALNEIARSCTLLCQNKGFSCNQPLLSGILWPRQGFDQEGDRSDPSIGSYRELLGVHNHNSSYSDSDSSSEDWDERLAQGSDAAQDDTDAADETAGASSGSVGGGSTSEIGGAAPGSKGASENDSDNAGYNYSDNDELDSSNDDIAATEAELEAEAEADADMDDAAWNQADDAVTGGFTKADDNSDIITGEVSAGGAGNADGAGNSSGQSSNFKDADDFNYAQAEGKSREQDKAANKAANKVANTADNKAADDAAGESENDDLSQDALKHACLQWPRSMSGYERSVSDMYALTPSFNLNKKCKALLDRRFERDGKWALSFMPTIFKKENSDYQRYQQRWNVLVDAIDPDGNLPDTKLQDDDYYLALFTLFTTTNLHEFPQSYFDLLNFSEDPATFLYAMDNRYDLETVKYYAVLERRLKSSVSLLQTASECYQIWEEFYQDFSSALPPIPKAQALRPVIYRQMLMRVWRLAGYPDPLHLRPQFAFVQGTNHHTITREPLEAKCSAFEGSNGDQFFFASSECIQGIYSDLGRRGLINEDFKQVQKSWDAFAQACSRSKMLTITGSSSMGENNRAGLALALVSLYKVYGFGDYFLLRNCLSTRDSDICAFQSFKSHQDYKSEFRNSVSSIAALSNQDAKTLNQLNELWRRYYDSLQTYTEHLVSRGRIESWRAHFVLGVAATTQTETLLSGPYYRQPVEPED